MIKFNSKDKETCEYHIYSGDLVHSYLGELQFTNTNHHSNTSIIVLQRYLKRPGSR